MEPRIQISRGIESFLDYLRETEQQLHMAEQSEQEANDATQDILHRLELCELEDEDAERLAYKLRIDQTAPVAAWLEERRTVVKELERLLGEVRKQERRASDRIYTPKTKVLEE